MFSILILTFNEEINLPGCLDSISWCDDIWVLDSGSTDRTVEIARNRGCHLLTRKFDNFGDQRNFAIDTASFKHPWVFDLDADERFTDALKAECDEMVRKDEHSAYYVSCKVMIWGKWIKHTSGYPVYQMRFHKLGEVRFVGWGHGQKESDSQRGVGYLTEPYIHYNFTKGLAHWFEKHVEYAKREARLRMELENHPQDIKGNDPIAKRRRLKQFFNKLPCKPLLHFLVAYFVKLGFLDGYPGLQFAIMRAWYQFTIDAIYRDLKRSQNSMGTDCGQTKADKGV